MSDIHANIYAFERVVKDLEREHVDYLVFLGDLVFFGLYPQECYELLKTLPLKYCIKGNTDANIEELQDFIPGNDFERNLYRMIEYAANRISPACKNELKSWNIVERECVGNRTLLYCHGSPYSFKDMLSPSNVHFDALKEKIRMEEADTILCGHTHKRERFAVGDKDIINVGAVGYPFDTTDKTRYGIIRIENDISCVFRDLDYDIEVYKKDIRRQKPVFGEDLLCVLEHGLERKNAMNTPAR